MPKAAVLMKTLAVGAQLRHKRTMGPELDLKQASRETLLAVIAEQRGVIAEQQDTIAQMGKRVEGLEARLSGGGPEARMPGHTPAARRKKPAEQEKKPRKKRPHGFARPRMEPTRRVVHVPESCPECHTTLSGGWVQRTREVIDIPVAPAEVTEHVFMARLCPLCRKRRLPREPLQGVAVGRQRLGVNLVSLIITLREEGRLPVRTIQWYLRTVHQLKLSVGAIVRTIHQAAQQAGPAVNEVLERIRRSPVVHADETGWRENGVNGYVWTFSTPTERYFLRRGRGGEVVDEALGEEFGGILASDFYAAYDHYPRLKQRCWAHLLRDIHKLKALYPEDAVLAKWANGVRWLYDRARAWAAAGGRLPARGELVLERRLLKLCRPFLEDPMAPQAKLCRRIERHIKELFVFVTHPDTPSDNNAAERSLRHLVISRKISGGTRLEAGSGSKMTLASLFGTWRARGLNPFLETRRLLISPQL